MKTLRLHATHDLRYHDDPSPTPGLGEVLLNVTAVGVCGSDLHWFQEGGIGDSALVHPLVLGHEFTACTESGIRVAVEPAIACEQCEYCIRGDPNLCENLVFAGHGENDGALRQEMAWPERCLFPLPDKLTNADGVMLEPLGVAMHAVGLGKIKPGMSVGVYGAGPIGLLVIQLARLAGARTIVVTDRLPHRLEAARALGATQVIPIGEKTNARELLSAAGRGGVDVAFEAAGENDAVEAAIETARPGSRVVLIGIPREDQTVFTASTARRKGLTIKLVRRMRHIYPQAIRLVETGQVDVRSLVTHTFPFEQAVEAFDTASRREGIKVLITF